MVINHLMHLSSAVWRKSARTRASGYRVFTRTRFVGIRRHCMWSLHNSTTKGMQAVEDTESD